MAVPRQGSVGTAARPSADTAVAEISSTPGDEEKNAVGRNSNQDQNDLEEEENNQQIMTAAWGRHGKIYMWIGFVLLGAKHNYHTADIYDSASH